MNASRNASLREGFAYADVKGYEYSWHWLNGTQLKEEAHRYREANGIQIMASSVAWPRTLCESMGSG